MDNNFRDQMLSYVFNFSHMGEVGQIKTNLAHDGQALPPSHLDAGFDCGQDRSCREHQTGQGEIRPED